MSERSSDSKVWWKVVPCHFIWKLEESADVDFRGIVNNLDSKLATRSEEEWRESACDMLLFRGYIEVSNFDGVQPNPQKAEHFFLEAEREAMRATDDDERQAYITVVTANRLWVLKSFQESSPDEGNRSKLLTDLENSWMRSREIECSGKRLDAFIDAIAAFALARLGPNKYKEAERRYQRALKTIVKSSWYQSLGAVIGRQGRGKTESYDDNYDGIDDEIKCYEKAIELDNQNSSAKCDLALALLKFPEREDEARDLIGRVEGNSCEVILKKGRFYRRDGDKQRALEVLLGGLNRIENVRSELYYLIACLYEDFATQAKKRGNWDEKIKCNRKTTKYVDKCLEKQPTHFNALRLKGIALGREGRKSEGEEMLRRVIEMYRHSPRCLIEAQNSLAKHLFINSNNKCNGDAAKAFEDMVDTGILILKNMDKHGNKQVSYFINSAQEILESYYIDLENGYVKIQTLRNKLSEI